MADIGPLTPLGMQGYIFVSYARLDKERVQPILSHLRQAGYNVWTDGLISVGAIWRKEIAAAVAGASCVLVLWSVNSVESEWVTDEEASEGKRRKILVAARIDHVEPPMGYKGIQAADLCVPRPAFPGGQLSEQQLKALNAEWNKLLQAIKKVYQRPTTRPKGSSKPTSSGGGGWWGVIVLLAFITAAWAYFQLAINP